MERFADPFYSSQAWKDCRAAFRKSRGGLCERCLARGIYTPGAEVHHKIPLTPDNYNDPSVSLNWDNLILLCKQCHLDVHHEMHRPERRWSVDESGNVYATG